MKRWIPYTSIKLARKWASIKIIINSTYGAGRRTDKIYFSLSFDSQELVNEKAAMGKVLVKDSQGHPFTQLEHVMGAFAYIVAINEDFKTMTGLTDR